LGLLSDEAIERGIGKTATLNGSLKVATIPFHRVCPICPHWTDGLDAVCNMQKSMNSEGTSRQTFGLALIIYPALHLENFEGDRI